MHVNGGNVLGVGGKTGMYNHFGGGKTLFSYVNLQLNNTVGGKTKQNLSFGSIAPVPPPGTCLLLIINELQKTVVINSYSNGVILSPIELLQQYDTKYRVASHGAKLSPAQMSYA